MFSSSKSSLFGAFAELLFTDRCAGCGAGRVALCPACRDRLAGEPFRCPPRPPPPGMPQVWAVARYGGAARAIVLAYKERGRHALAPTLGWALSRAIAAQLPTPPTNGPRSGPRADPHDGPCGSPCGDPHDGPCGSPRGYPHDDPRGAPPGGPPGAATGAPSGAPPRAPADGPPGAPAGGRADDRLSVLLVPVPSRSWAGVRRGHDPVGTLAQEAARLLTKSGHRVDHSRLLGYARFVADQAGLSAAARAANLSGALRVRTGRSPPADRPLVIVDDVVTTGATLAEAARALRAQGLRVHGAAVVAATPRIAP